MEFEAVADWIVRGVGVYLGVGLLFGGGFVLLGVERIDPGAKGASWGFRLIVLPAAIALWPLVARRWISASGSPRVESNAHRRAADRGGTT